MRYQARRGNLNDGGERETTVIRQARIYLAGAVSGTTLVVAAVVGFVVLVSLQSLQDWPLAGLHVGGHNSSGNAAVAPGHPAAKGTGGGGGTGGTAATTPNRATGTANGTQTAGGIDTATTTPGSSGPTAVAPRPGHPATGGGKRASSVSPGESTANGGKSGSATGGGNEGATKAGNEGVGAQVTETATGAVNEATKGVDATAGQTEGETGIVGTTEEVVHSVIGPSPKASPKATEAVGGLLGGNG